MNGVSYSADELEMLWSGLLSEDPPQVRAAFDTLTAQEQAAVKAHLACMVSEPGWHPAQRRSAQAALDALEGWQHAP